MTFTDAEKARLKASARKHVLGHWMDNADLDKGVKIFTHGKGCRITDIDGNEFIDTFSNLVTCAIGHGREEIRLAIDEQLKALEFFPNYHDGFSAPLVKLAEKLAEIAPGDLEVTFFLNSGSEANETAVKMARQYFWQNGQKGRYKVISRRCSYHGTTLAATSWTGFSALREPVEPLMPGSIYAPQVKCSECEMGLKLPGCNMACLRELERIVVSEGPDTIAAIIMDPLPGSNSGYPVPPKGYLQGVRDLCDKYGILLIFDEVQTGFATTGKWFACEHFGVTPDILDVSKSITSGYAPLGACITTQKIASAFSEPGKEFRSGSTYGGHGISCAAALANIEIMEREHLVERAAELGKKIREKLTELMEFDVVGDIQGMGTLWAIELMDDREKRTKLAEPYGVFIRDWCYEHGMILRNNGNMLVIAPPIVITDEELDLVMNNLRQAIQAAMKHFNR